MTDEHIENQRVARLHPAAKAFNEWLNSEEGKACTEGVQIGAELHGHYMENRCRRAYNAGYRGALKKCLETGEVVLGVDKSDGD